MPLQPSHWIALLAQVTEEQLQQRFAVYGQVMEVTVYRKGSYGFVRFARHADAVRAIAHMNGCLVSGRTLKCSWGRHQISVQQVPCVQPRI